MSRHPAEGSKRRGACCGRALRRHVTRFDGRIKAAPSEHHNKHWGTEGSLQHLWYAVPLLALVAYIYAREVKACRASGIWDPLFAALVMFGCDLFNETWNGWVFHLSKRSAVWTTPGDTAFRVMVGWNLEIIFTFLLLGLVYYHSFLPDKERKILGLPNRWFFALFFTCFCVLVEVILNLGDLLVWEYPWWNRSFAGIWLIFLLGYFYWFAAANLVLELKSDLAKLKATAAIYAVPLAMNILAWTLGFRY